MLVQSQNGSILFPSVCPNCGRSGATPLRIERAFIFHVQSDDSTPNGTEQSVDTFWVSFCDACLRQHAAEHRKPSWSLPLRRILFDAEGPAGMVVLAVAAFFFASGLRRLSAFPLILGCFPLAVGFWLVRGTWKKSGALSVPKPTSVDASIDFTPCIALQFEPAWRAFEFRSLPYADLFRQANCHQLWNPKGSRAHSAADRRRKASMRTNLVVGAVIAAFLLWYLWHEVLAAYVLPYLGE